MEDTVVGKCSENDEISETYESDSRWLQAIFVNFIAFLIRGDSSACIWYERKAR